MKKILVITACVTLVTVIISCGGRRNPGRAYMPDMAYSTAYETYAPAQERLKHSSAEGASADGGITYTGKPVEGTMARGDMMPFKLKNDTSDYAKSATVKNPLDLASINMKEAERLYLVNCGICHGTKLDGNGPLFASGAYPAKPATLVGDAKYEAMTEGTMFHAVTYGKNAMGSYASQLNTEQRWMVIAYIKSKQGGGASAATPAGDSTGTTKPDSVTAKAG
jgi:mono/diheme cytochrome c family protein